MAFVPPLAHDVEFTLTGATDLDQQIERRLNDWVARHSDISVELHAGSGKRAADVNAMIAKVQAKQKRDPWFFDREMLADIKQLITRAASFPRQWRMRELRRVGDRMLAGVLAHVRDQTNKRGAFRALTEEYAKAKQRKHGFVTPILVATGELTLQLTTKVRRRRIRRR